MIGTRPYPEFYRYFTATIIYCIFLCSFTIFKFFVLPKILILDTIHRLFLSDTFHRICEADITFNSKPFTCSNTANIKTTHILDFQSLSKECTRIYKISCHYSKTLRIEICTIFTWFLIPHSVEAQQWHNKMNDLCMPILKIHSICRA